MCIDPPKNCNYKTLFVYTKQGIKSDQIDLTNSDLSRFFSPIEIKMEPLRIWFFRGEMLEQYGIRNNWLNRRISPESVNYPPYCGCNCSATK